MLRRMKNTAKTRVAASALLLTLATACADDPKRNARDRDDQGPADAATLDVGLSVVDAGLSAIDAARVDAAPAPDDAAPLALADAGDGAAPPPQVLSVETRVGTPSTIAGLANRVTCEALDAEGVPVADVITRFEVRPGDGWRLGDEDPRSVVGERAGAYRITCVAPGIGLRDETPTRWDVLAGPPQTIVAVLDREVSQAGDTVGVTCLAWDAEGNPVDASEATVQAAPAGAGVEVTEAGVRVTAAGRYQINCALAGAKVEAAARLDVVPGPPASLAAAVDPAAPVHDVGAVITYRARVTDAFGNPIDDAELVWSSGPALPGFGEGRFRPDEEGRYTLYVHVEGATFEDRDLEASADVLVDAGGPAIACTSPTLGAMVHRAARLRLLGRVSDQAGLGEISVDGQVVQPDAGGVFAVDVAPRWGVNVHEVTARDAVGNVNSTLCAYFAADSYLPEAAPLADAIQLQMLQAAIDDGAPDRPLTSLTDLLRRVVDSPGLVSSIDQTLRAQNPVVPNECRQRVLGVCVLRLGAEYRGMRLRGPNSMSATLVDGGLRVRVRLERLELDVKMLGTITNSGTLTSSFIALDLTFAIELQNGRPAVRLRTTNSVQVGDLSSNFSGFLTGALLDLVFSAFEGTIRREVVSALTGFLEGEIDSLLSGVLSGLDLNALGLAFEVPSLAGQPAAELSLGLGFSTLSTNPRRLAVGISTVANGPTGQGAASAGVPMPPGAVRLELEPRGTVGAAIHVGLLNQLLHRLWRAGFFTFDQASGLLGDLPAGTEVTLQVLVPPAVEGLADGSGVRLHLGPAVGALRVPGILDEPLRLTLAATAIAEVRLVGGDTLVFGGADGVQIETLRLALDDTSISPEGRAAVERDLRRIVQALIDTSLNNVLPTLPVPDFALPDALAPYGVPRGTRLGLRQPMLSGTVSHFLVDGVFRE